MKRPFARIISTTMVGAAAIMVTACSTGQHPMDAGQRISARGDAISGRGQDWTGGQRDVEKGRTLVARSADRTADGEKKLKRAQNAAAKAQGQIEEARSDQSNGEQLISGGTARMQQAEADYTAIRNGPSAVAPQ